MSAPPQKFIQDHNGVRKLNPAYKQFMDAQNRAQQASGQAPATNFVIPQMTNAIQALPVVATKEEVAKHLGPNTKIAETVNATEEMLTDPDIAKEVGLPPDETMANLNKLFAKYEIPLGLSNKLFALSEYSIALLLIDDSGSMNMSGSLRFPNGALMTRWQEVYTRLGQMIEVFACVPCPPIVVRFLNRPQVLELKKNPGENPENFHRRAMAIVTSVFQQPPAGTTPFKERLQELFHIYAQHPVTYYFFGDGEPNGGAMAARAITQMLISRPNPSQSPFTFLSCSNDDQAVAWMKEAEEAAPYCSELDDFEAEAQEVLGDQGQGLPFSYGLWLICCVCASFNPNDLDALDESCPMSKQTLDNILGYQTSIQEYQYYFDLMLRTQGNKPVETALDKLKRDYIPFWKRESHLQ